MMIINLCLLIILIKYSFSKTFITTYPIVDLLENSPINTLVVSLESSIKNVTNSTKFVLLNLNEYELNKFSIINGNIYTISSIDREEFLDKKYCLDNLYCKIELHILVNDGLEYCIIPIHIIDENDNKPEFREKEIELKFRENILNGYKIPFEGAKDLDEGENSKINYILDCSNNNKNKILINCFPLFELIIISQSFSSLNYDKLSLKFVPSLLINIKNEYKLKVYAIDKNKNNKNSLNLNIKIEQKEKLLKFSLLKYEFIILLNSSSFILNENKNKNKNENLNLIGRVYAISNNPFHTIYYKILTTNNNNITKFIQINSLTGQLTFINNNLNNLNNDQIEFNVQASILSKNNSSNLLISTTNVKVYFRYFNYLNNISFKFKINYQKKNQIFQLNSSSSSSLNTFFIDKNIKINENLFEIFINSFYYPFDKYILSLDNYLNIFSLTSSSLTNNYILKTNQQLISTSIYLLNIGIKHKLSQQWLSNLKIELIIIDQWITSTIQNNIIIKTSTNINLINKSFQFCIKDKIYILNEINKNNKTNQIGLFKVIKSNSILLNNLFIYLNKSEIIINGCQMFIEKLNKTLLNKSLEYQLCSFISIKDKCYNIKIKDQNNFISIKNKKENQIFSSIKSIELIMLIISIIFIFITIILILLICRLNQIKICFKIKKNLFYENNSHLNNVQQHLSLSSSSSNIKERVHSIVLHNSPSFQSIRIKNDPFIFNIDDLIQQQQESFPSTNIFVLPSIEKSSLTSSLTYSIDKKQNQLTTLHQTSSSSSFLQETKQLLDIISNNQNIDSSKSVSQV